MSAGSNSIDELFAGCGDSKKAVARILMASWFQGEENGIGQSIKTDMRTGPPSWSISNLSTSSLLGGGVGGSPWSGRTFFVLRNCLSAVCENDNDRISRLFDSTYMKVRFLRVSGTPAWSMLSVSVISIRLNLSPGSATRRNSLLHLMVRCIHGICTFLYTGLNSL